MKAKDFRQEQDYPHNYFIKLTNTGISADYDHIEAFAETYHKSKVKNLGLFSVMERYGLEEDFESKVVRMIDLKIKMRRFGLEDNEHNELDELQDWFTWGNWRNG